MCIIIICDIFVFQIYKTTGGSKTSQTSDLRIVKDIVKKDLAIF